MYFYIYDSFLQSNRYSKTLHKIENRVHDLGIGGRITKLSILRNIQEVVHDEYHAGVHNFIAVGNDITLLNLIHVVADLNVSIGYIPIGSDNILADVFGIPPEELACDILSARIIKTMDIGIVNGFYFLKNIKIQSNQVEIVCDAHYTVMPESNHLDIRVINLLDVRPRLDLHRQIKANDGKLNVCIKQQESMLGGIFHKHNMYESFFTAENIYIRSLEDVKVLIDDHKTFKTPLKISIHKNGLSMIVGKNRKVLTDII